MVYRRMVRNLDRSKLRPVYFKRGPCGLWHWYPKTRNTTTKDQTA